MDNALTIDIGTASATDDLANRRLSKGYSFEDLAISTGLTADEIAQAEDGNAPIAHVERIQHALG